MKKAGILLILIMMFQNAFAQNWKLINKNEKYNYLCNNIYYTVYTDSTKEIGGDSVYFLNKVTKRIKPYTSSGTSYLPNQSQFFLSKIIYKSEVALMQKNDSVKFLIKPYSNLNDTWVFDSLRHDTAKVIAASESTVFGTVDSIKIITVRNSDTIILSKNHGILKFPVYDSLPKHVTLVGIEGRNLGLSIPKFDEFFDFTVGDIFYYKLFQGLGRIGSETTQKKITIKSKQVLGSKIKYTVDYTHKKVRVSFSPNDTTTSYYSTKDSVITHEDSTSNYLNRYPNEPIGGSVSTVEFKPIHVYNNQKWQTITKSHSTNVFCPPKTDTIIETTSMLGCPGAFPDAVGMTHGKGIGHILLYKGSFNGTSHTGSWKEELLGYVRNGKVTGTVIPDSIFLSVPKYSKSTNYKIYPNPAKNSFIIEALENKGKQDITIFDIRGVQVMETQMNNKAEIDISHLSNGMYFLKLIDDQSIDVIKMLKE